MASGRSVFHILPPGLQYPGYDTSSFGGKSLVYVSRTSTGTVALALILVGLGAYG
jgi:hypothetical protein